jgi:probable blue pigment (indigoidine) exporter
MVFTAWQLVVGGIELALFATLAGDVPTLLTAQNVLGFAYVALIGTTLAYGLWFYGIEGIGVSAAAPFFLLIPIVAFVLDAVIRGFVPTMVQGIGAAIVLGSLLIGQLSARRKPAPQRVS